MARNSHPYHISRLSLYRHDNFGQLADATEQLVGVLVEGVFAAQALDEARHVLPRVRNFLELFVDVAFVNIGAGFDLFQQDLKTSNAAVKMQSRLSFIEARSPVGVNAQAQNRWR